MLFIHDHFLLYEQRSWITYLNMAGIFEYNVDRFPIIFLSKTFYTAQYGDRLGTCSLSDAVKTKIVPGIRTGEQLLFCLHRHVWKIDRRTEATQRETEKETERKKER